MNEFFLLLYATFKKKKKIYTGDENQEFRYNPVCVHLENVDVLNLPSVQVTMTFKKENSSSSTQ